MSLRHRDTRSSDGTRRRSVSSSRLHHESGWGSSAFVTGTSSSRVAWTIVVFLFAAMILVGKIFYLTLIDGPNKKEDAAAAHTITVNVTPKRGTIYDRNGVVLATDVEATTVYCNPFEVTDKTGTATLIAEVLGGEPNDYLDALEESSASFVYIKRNVDKAVADVLKEKELAGIHFLDSRKRSYPCGQIAGQVVGMCDPDHKGISGLELYYDKILAGTPGKSIIEQGGKNPGKSDVKNYPIPGGFSEVEPAVDGQDIVVSLDVEMQEFLELRLQEGVDEIGGKRGSAVLYDGSTGEILACASLPFLNPADRSDIEEGASTLMAINSEYEPGSTFKAATMAAVLEAGIGSPDSEIYCPEELPADEYVIRDAHERSATTFTLSQILAASSNVGTSLAAQKLGFPALYDKIVQYGFTKETGVDFPGERSGTCANQKDWSLVRAYNVSFGQGLQVTPLQVTRFYGALANDGIACQPHFLVSYSQTGEKPTYETERIIENTDAISQLDEMLIGVTESELGTGQKAAIEGYHVAGKTGTAQLADASGRYREGFYNISFVGYLPYADSDIVCFVGATEVPGERQIVDSFHDIMSFAINHYRIAAQ